MLDREKVIIAVEDAFDLVHSDFIGTDDFNEKEWEQNKADALALLKEQEAVEPKTGHWVSVNDGDIVAIDNDGCPERACFCSECEKYLIASDEYAVYGRYCPFCGAKMKQEGR